MRKIIFMIVGVLIISGLIIFISFKLSTEGEKNVDNGMEIEPEEEIDENQNFDTIVKLYYVDSMSGIIVPEERSVDARKLIDNPYVFVIKELLKKPENENLKMIIPDNTIVYSAVLEKNIVKVDLSENFLEIKDTNAIYCIVNSLCELNEVSGVKFTFNGVEKENFKDIYVKKF